MEPPFILKTALVFKYTIAFVLLLTPFSRPPSKVKVLPVRYTALVALAVLNRPFSITKLALLSA